MKLLTKVLVVGVLALGVSGAWWYHHVTQKTTSTTVKQTKVTHVNLTALGDSLTHGVGDTKKQSGYVGRIKTALAHKQGVTVTTNNFGKTGDRSDQILARLQASKQQQQAVKHATVITLTVGGNDLMQTLQKNVVSLLTNNLAKVMPKAEKQYQAKLVKLLTAIRKYNQTAPIYVFSVYNPFYVYFPTLTDLTKYTNRWNNVTKTTLKRYTNTHFIDINGQLSQGQYNGKSKAKLEKTTYLNLSKLSSGKLESLLANQKEKNNYLSSADHFHPNAKGYDYMARQLYRTMMQSEASWLLKNN